ncbi:MAG: hypothetical protein KOO66_14030 [Bacteroidales bacterium]|nr:hypothetical protein [Bacteroidales bacterium]
MKKLLSVAYIAITMLFTLHVVAQDSESSIKKLNVKIGYATFNYSDPSLTGENSFFNSGGTNTGTYNGYRNLSGISFKLSYQLNNNVGLFADATLTNKTSEHYVDPAMYKTNADNNLIKLGFSGQVVGKDFPVKLNMGTGLVLSIFSFDSSTEPDTGEGTYLAKKDNYPGFFFATEVSIPIYKFIHIFSRLEYIYIPVSSMDIEHSGGTDYYISYYDLNLGGLQFSTGLGIDIF